MSPETKKLLERFDEPDAYEFPSGFDYPDLERRAKLVYGDIENLGIRIGFEGASYNQDASFSIAILLHEYQRKDPMTISQPTIRFSNFGNLATLTWIDQVPEAAIGRIRASLGRHGFTYVSEAELDCDYDGIMEERRDVFRTWWTRYFDWL